MLQVGSIIRLVREREPIRLSWKDGIVRGSGRLSRDVELAEHFLLATEAVIGTARVDIEPGKSVSLGELAGFRSPDVGDARRNSYASSWTASPSR